MPCGVGTEPATFSMFCQHCGYHLHGLPENRCPECARVFDSNNPKSYFKRAGSLWRRRWAKRIAVALGTLILLASIVGFSLWWPWYREQAAIRMVRNWHNDDPSSAMLLPRGSVRTRMIGPQNLQMLLGRFGYLLQRVCQIQFNGQDYSIQHIENSTVKGLTISDSELAELDGLPYLCELSLAGCDLRGSGFGELETLKQLQTLNLSSCSGVTGDAVEHLKGFKGLHVIWLNDSDVTDEGLIHLKELTALRELYLGRARVTNTGLQQLKCLTQLQMLYLDGTQVTDAGVAALRRALPRCNITPSGHPGLWLEIDIPLSRVKQSPQASH
jgi:hypothetical protein